MGLKRCLTALAAVIIPFTTLYSQTSAAASADSGNTAWILTSAALVLLMTVPGLAIFYGGMVRKKNVLSTLYTSFASAILVSALWVIFQYTLSFGKDVGGLIGNLDKAFFNGIDKDTLFGTTNIPESVFSAYQMMFAVITVALISGALVERLKFSAWIVFILLWTTLVYTPLAHWVWGGGWLSRLGDILGFKGLSTLDFAGGLVVHISSGISSLVAVLFIGERLHFNTENFLPQSVTLTFIGTGLLWFGWFGFNAGSALSAGGQAGSAFMATNTAAVFGAIVWIVLEWIRLGKPSLIGGASGLVAGLATITPASGFVDIKSAILIGILAGLVTYFFVAVVKKRLGYDDSLDAFGIHGISGVTGIILTGVLASPAIGGASGLVYGNLGQFVVQSVAAITGVIYSGVLTWLILLLIKYVFRMKLRPTEQEETAGLDISLHGEKES